MLLITPGALSREDQTLYFILHPPSISQLDRLA
jgi:hypothetical protein